MSISILWSLLHCNGFGTAICRGSFKRGIMSLLLRARHFSPLLMFPTQEESVAVFLQGCQLELPCLKISFVAVDEHTSKPPCLFVLDLEEMVCWGKDQFLSKNRIYHWSPCDTAFGIAPIWLILVWGAPLKGLATIQPADLCNYFNGLFLSFNGFC